MFAFNAVRFRVKPDQVAAFIEAHRKMQAQMPGLHRAALIKTGEHSFCFVGEWDSMSDIANARPSMIGILDSMRHMLEDLGADLGVTDPVSGEVVVEIAPRQKKPAMKAKPRKPAKKAAPKKKKKR